MTHHIKLHKNYADPVLDGTKPFEIRFNDRGYQTGDRVVFRCVDDMGCTVPHPLDREAFQITYIVHGYGLKENWCVFGIKKIAQKEADG